MPCNYVGNEDGKLYWKINIFMSSSVSGDMHGRKDVIKQKVCSYGK